MPVKTMSGAGPATPIPFRLSLRLATQAAQRVVWVYAITDGLGPRQFASLAGVGGEAVRTVAEAGLTAVVGSVEARAFGEDALAGLLGTWTTSSGSAGRRRSSPGPRRRRSGSCRSGWLRLSDDDTVRALLAQRRGEFTGLLGPLPGHGGMGGPGLWPGRPAGGG